MHHESHGAVDPSSGFRLVGSILDIPRLEGRGALRRQTGEQHVVTSHREWGTTVGDGYQYTGHSLRGKRRKEHEFTSRGGARVR